MVGVIESVYLVIGFVNQAVVVTLVLLSVMGLGRWRLSRRASRAAEVVALLVATTTVLLTLAYLTEVVIALGGNDPFERFAFLNRTVGPAAWFYYVQLFGWCLLPLLLWIRRVRRARAARLLIAVLNLLTLLLTLAVNSQLS